MERVTARDSGAVVLCKRAGVVDSVDSERIIVRVEGGRITKGSFPRSGRRYYQLTKFKRSEPEYLHQPEADRAATGSA
jgi:DNA-directed RNA polymerase subunit beta